jgi:anti-anti-sigma factor
VPTDSHGRSAGFQVTIARDGSACLEISGELDVTTIPALTRQLARLADLRPGRLVIDLSGLAYLDCASASLLASTAALLPAGRSLVLASARPEVRRLLQVTGLAGRVELAD